MGKKPQKLPFPRDFVTLPEEDRATAVGNMHRKFGKDRAYMVPDISQGQTDRETDRQTDTLNTILRNSSREQSNNLMYAKK